MYSIEEEVQEELLNNNGIKRKKLQHQQLLKRYYKCKRTIVFRMRCDYGNMNKWILVAVLCVTGVRQSTSSIHFYSRYTQFLPAKHA